MLRSLRGHFQVHQTEQQGGTTLVLVKQSQLRKGFGSRVKHWVQYLWRKQGIGTHWCFQWLVSARRRAVLDLCRSFLRHAVSQQWPILDMWDTFIRHTKRLYKWYCDSEGSKVPQIALGKCFWQMNLSSCFPSSAYHCSRKFHCDMWNYCMWYRKGYIPHLPPANFIR